MQCAYLICRAIVFLNKLYFSSIGQKLTPREVCEHSIVSLFYVMCQCNSTLNIGLCFLLKLAEGVILKLLYINLIKE